MAGIEQQLDLVGGEEYLIRLAEAVPSATNAVKAAMIAPMIAPAVTTGSLLIFVSMFHLKMSRE